MSSLLTNLASDSAARVRLLAKFVENDYEKVEKLLEIRDNACTRLKAIDSVIDAEKKVGPNDMVETSHNCISQEMPTEEDIILEENAWYLRRLDGGLFTLQSVDYILAWLIMEDDGVSSDYYAAICHL